MIRTRLNWLLLCTLFVVYVSPAQKLALKKGVVIDSLTINDSIPDTFSLFLPERFEMKGSWPLLTIFDLNGRTKTMMSGFISQANRNGFVVAAPEALHDSLSLSENMVKSKRVMEHVMNLLPINKSRVYAAGMEDGGQFASLVPVFLKDVEGTFVINASIANTQLLNPNNPFHFIGVADRSNYNYPQLLRDEKVLNALRLPNTVLVGKEISRDPGKFIDQALAYFNLLAMARGLMNKDSSYIANAYADDIKIVDQFIGEGDLLAADRAMGETLSGFRTLMPLDSLRNVRKTLRKNKSYRVQKREEEAAFFKESLLREDFAYYLEEDVLTYNFNNLGWWNYQMEQLNKFMSGETSAEKAMGHRLLGYVNALVADNIDVVKDKDPIDEEALVLLYMLKTILAPKDFGNYTKVASIASKNEDYGTALFYIEEALKQGYDSKEGLYSIPHTELLRITPEFNALIKKYFDGAARYELNDN